MDIVSKTIRSRMMAGIRNKNTRPEMLVRKLLHASGLRYRLHRRDLPGAPDIVLTRYGAVIFVHGCFWHMHVGCRLAKIPESNRAFWVRKLGENQARDRRQVDALRSLGWRVLVVWECLIRDKMHAERLREEIVNWVLGDLAYLEIPG
jgi:DNA mismatch endonuclease (patch repair protein)